MIIPIRCFTCGKVIANKYETYSRMLLEDKEPGCVGGRSQIFHSAWRSGGPAPGASHAT